MGFHNWLRMYLEEKAGRFNYLGHIPPRGGGGERGDDARLAPEARQLVTVQFAWGDEVKSVSSSLVGTSPEFEIALYTLCFLAGEHENVVRCGPYDVLVTCFTQHGRIGANRGKTFIGSSFPGVPRSGQHRASPAAELRTQAPGSRRLGVHRDEHRRPPEQRAQAPGSRRLGVHRDENRPPPERRTRAPGSRRLGVHRDE